MPVNPLELYLVNYEVNYLLIIYYAGVPLKPAVSVQPGQLINLSVNDFNLSMQCGHDNKDFDYYWEKRNEKIHLRAQEVNSHQLTITNLKPEDSGEYRCAMSNATGKIFSDYISITITGLLFIYCA